MKIKFENNQEKTVYQLGVMAGVSSMMNKIETHYKKNMPILINGRLYFIRDDKDNLNDLMNNWGK